MPRAPKVQFKKTTLDNGVRVLTENFSYSRAVACGVWINKGTRDEKADESGLAHFVEHLVFKRTAKRSAYQISREMEAVGGDLNAFTSRESTCFVTMSLSEDLALSLDVLGDLVCRPVFDARDIRKEKTVVVQEISMTEDQPDDAIFDRFFELFFAGSTLARPILGSAKSVQNMSRARIVEFHRRLYRPENTIVTVTGRCDHNEVVRQVEKHLRFAKLSNAALRAQESSARMANQVSSAIDASAVTAAAQSAVFRNVIARSSEQAHLVMGFGAFENSDPLRFAGALINGYLGGGLTSKLYQSVREDRGLVYSIFSQMNSFRGAGVCTIYAGTDAKKIPQVVELILKELRALKRNGIKKADLEFFKTQVLGALMLSADDIENRMNALGSNEMFLGTYRSIDEVMRDVKAVDLAAVHECIETRLKLDAVSMLTMGPMSQKSMEKRLRAL